MLHVHKSATSAILDMRNKIPWLWNHCVINAIYVDKSTMQSHF